MNTFVSTAFIHLVTRGSPPIQADESLFTKLGKRPVAFLFRRGCDLHEADSNGHLGMFGKGQVLCRLQVTVLERDSDISIDRHDDFTAAAPDRESEEFHERGASWNNPSLLGRSAEHTLRLTHASPFSGIES